MKSTSQLVLLLLVAHAANSSMANDGLTPAPWDVQRHAYEIQRQRYLYEQAKAFAHYNYQHALVELARRYPYPPPPVPGSWGGGNVAFFWWNQQQSQRLIHPDLVAPGPWHTIPWRVNPGELYPPAPRAGPRRF